MEHNQYLNEILYLIEKAYLTDDIDKHHLKQIEVLVKNISSSNKSFKPKYFNLPIVKIPNFIANEYIKIFDRNLSNNTKLKKIFSIKSTLLNESISNKKDTIIRFIEYNGSFELAYLIDNESFLIDCKNDKLIPITKDELNKYGSDFELNAGKVLDDTLYKLSNNTKKNNTRKITIPFAENFENFEIDDSEYIHFFSSIINNPNADYHNKFTFVMCFGKKDEHYNLRLPMNNQSINYYDTFQLCPPTNPPGGTC